MRTPSWLRLLLALTAIVPPLSACDDTPPPPPPRDGGGRDGGGGGDGGGMDAMVPDGSMGDDGGGVDATVRRDAGVPVCTSDMMDVIKLATDTRSQDRIVGLAGGGDRFGIVWNEARGGTPDIYGVTLGSDGTRGTEVAITSDPSAEAYATIAAVGTQWLASFVDNEGATSFELRAVPLAANMMPSGAPVRLTTTAAQLEDNPTLLNTASGLLAAWVEDDMVASTRTGRAMPLSTSGTSTGAAQTTTASGARPGQIALGLLDAGPVLVWAEGFAGSSSVLMQGLRADGSVRGATTTISTEANADGTVDAALTDTGGAIVFGALADGVRREVRFRGVSLDGTLTGAERILTEFPSTGGDASIAMFAGGYVVSYRRQATGGDPVQIRLLLVTEAGDVLDDLVVAQAQPAGGRTTVRVSGDGQIAVTWADAQSSGTDIRVALVRCGGGM